MIYERTKTNVNIEALTFEIKESTVITTELISITFNELNDLKIDFASTLTSAEETELNTVVTNHTGVVLKHYRMYCGACGDYRSIKRDNTPTDCPVCQSTNITNIVEQTPYNSVKDESGNSWEKFMTSDGNTIISRRY